MAKPRIYKDGDYWVGDFGLNEQVVGLEWAYVVAYLKRWYQSMARSSRLMA